MQYGITSNCYYVFPEEIPAEHPATRVTRKYILERMNKKCFDALREVAKESNKPVGLNKRTLHLTIG